MATHSPQSTSHRYASERGSVLVQVGIALIVLIAFLSFVADYGLMWVARRQAQNAADAGALAGAIALGYDDFADRGATGPAKESAHKVALSHFVAAEAPIVDINTDVYFYDDDPDKFPDECADDSCIRVDVYRNQDEGNPLPVWFGQLVGLVNQGVRATAIARAAFGNATECLKPWAVIDRWTENWEDGAQATEPFSLDSEFDKYVVNGPDAGELRTDISDPPGPDEYVAASVQYDGETPLWGTYQAGTGYHPFTFNGDGTVQGYTSDYGMQLALMVGDAGTFQWGAGWFMRLNLCSLINREVEHMYPPPDNEGANCYNWIIKNCMGAAVTIGQEIEFDNAPGVATGPTRQGVETDDEEDGGGPSLINQDPGAYWDQSLNDGRGGVAGSMFPSSPRIVAIPLINPDELAANLNGGRNTVPIGNIAGFFIERVEGAGASMKVIGRLMTVPGLKTASNGGRAPSTFMLNISLIR